jgi:hypothetical protein
MDIVGHTRKSLTPLSNSNSKETFALSRVTQAMTACSPKPNFLHYSIQSEVIAAMRIHSRYASIGESEQDIPFHTTFKAGA